MAELNKNDIQNNKEEVPFAHYEALFRALDPDEAALPVEEQAMIFAPASPAFATAIAEARSFNDAVGLMPSSLTQSFLMPRSSASFGSS